MICTMPVVNGSSFISNMFFFAIGIHVSKRRCLSSSTSTTKLLNEEAQPFVHAIDFIEAVLIIGLLMLMDSVRQLGNLVVLVGNSHD